MRKCVQIEINSAFEKFVKSHCISLPISIKLSLKRNAHVLFSSPQRPQTATSVASSKRSVQVIRLQPPDPLPGTQTVDYPQDPFPLIRGLDTVIATDDARVCPRYSWLPLPTRSERLQRLIETRERYGWDHGLPGVPKEPFERHLAELFSERNVEIEAA